MAWCALFRVVAECALFRVVAVWWGCALFRVVTVWQGCALFRIVSCMSLLQKSGTSFSLRISTVKKLTASSE